ncbi:tubulin binding cofactor A [Fistulina hepatica ATCC 64428]|uniref:Tubulin-specific chaperone A n=1 Tax=Fistulina hepatica ATCC 64428 TaxID=1128425 RepID=A0A0D7A623_9AGAR|nr:tubulin binding cofactor A [Fistulina hepatica ATCC 64428]
MSEESQFRRQLKIKSGAALRLVKEYQLYKREEVDQKAKVDKMVAENADGWDVRAATRILEESQKMITNSASRYEAAIGDLKDLVALANEKYGLTMEDADVAAAEQTIKRSESA